MSRLPSSIALMIAALLAVLLPPRSAVAAEPPSPLVSVGWLLEHRSDPALKLLDAQPAPLHRKAHIAGAVNTDLMSYGPLEVPRPALEQRLRGWGLSNGQTLVVYDQGGTWQAAKLFWDLLHQGVPADRLRLLDGGLAAWQAAGGAVTSEPTPPPPPGNLALAAADEGVRVRLPEFLAASGDPARHRIVDALDPDYFYGGAAFFDRGGHVPHAVSMPVGDFFAADKTFKPADQIRRLLRHHGVKPGQPVLSYCGGGGAAAVPFFALRFLAGHAEVRLFQESQIGWLQDPRGLPLWTYGNPQLLRDAAWVRTWAGPMLKGFGLSKVSVLDLRPAEAFALGHLPQAINLPAAALAARRDDPAALAALLAEAGVPPDDEWVLMSDGGLDPAAALAFATLETLAPRGLSIALDTLDRWAELGYEVERAGASNNPMRARPPVRVAAAAYGAARRDVWAGPEPAGALARVWVATGRAASAGAPRLPAAELAPGGRPLPAREIWRRMAQAGVPRLAELVTTADEPGDAALGYVLLRLMGLPEVRVALAGR